MIDTEPAGRSWSLPNATRDRDLVRAVTALHAWHGMTWTAIDTGGRPGRQVW